MDFLKKSSIVVHSIYFMKFLFYSILLFILTILLNVVYTDKINEYFYNTVVDPDVCITGFGTILHCEYFLLYVFTEWIAIEMLSLQLVLLLILTINKTYSEKINVNEFQQIEELEMANVKYTIWIKRLRFIANLLILLFYTPLYLYLFINRFRNGMNAQNEGIILFLIFVDLFLTIIIIAQFFITAGNIYNKISMGSILQKKSWKDKSQVIYVLYLTSTFFPDTYLFNTDGFIAVTSFIAIAFLLCIWYFDYIYVPRCIKNEEMEKFEFERNYQ